MALSAADGQIRSGVDGAFWADRRLVSRLVVTADGHEPEAVRVATPAPGRARFLGVLRDLGDGGPDPTVTLQRDREVVEQGLVERIAIVSSARAPVRTAVALEVGCDLAGMSVVKSGGRPAARAARTAADGVVWDGPDGSMVRLQCTPAPDRVEGSTLHWAAAVERGAPFVVTVQARLVDGPTPVVLPSEHGVRPERFSVRSGDNRLDRLVEQSLTDLDSLCLVDPLEPADRFLAAGAPWFLTLFGRDAIWAARMLLPLGTELAGGTLRALARRQGTVLDPGSAQEPGKIMHEIRPDDSVSHGADFRLPPLYYGTVDATALWISLLHDAWRWGLPSDEVIALLPAAQRAMAWLTDHAVGGAGFVSYRDPTGTGLANQGWKDSGDSVQFRDGSLAAPPIALCEVQGYAFAAAHQAAELADAFGLPDGARWRRFGQTLGERFRASFWLEDELGRYPAIALDRDGRRVDTVTSNIAHLLGTGMLDAAEERAVVTRLAGPDMDSGYGLRTMSSRSSGFNPLAYHGGSVWTHDTAIAIGGLAASGDPAAAAVAVSLVEGLLAAAPAFDFRLPELFGGHARAEFSEAVPYPAACRPQAWSAAAAVAAVAALLGVRPDAPAGALRLRPVRPSPVGSLEVTGLRLGGRSFDVGLDRDGDPSVRGLGGIRVDVG